MLFINFNHLTANCQFMVSEHLRLPTYHLLSLIGVIYRNDKDKKDPVDKERHVHKHEVFLHRYKVGTYVLMRT